MNLAASVAEAPKFTVVNSRNVASFPLWKKLRPGLKEAIRVVSAVLPFRTNNYVVNELIDWDRVPEDPIYQLTFPQRGMLAEDDYRRMAGLVLSDAPRAEIRAAADDIRFALNPHPAGQLTHNGAYLDGRPLPGLQHKYRETVLYFPIQSQTCHAYCSYCFRWAQFVGMEELKMASRQVQDLVEYLKRHKEVTDVLLTGGDPMVMKASVLAKILEPLLAPELAHIRNIRIGTKSLAYWPHKYTTDPDADETLKLFEKVVARGKQLALMAHFSHPAQLATVVARQALKRIRATGANIRMQSPIVRHINDDVKAWADLWRTGTQLGAIPYYMFVERDTGARQYFEIPLERAWRIFRDAYRQVPGLSRTVRGPSMSATPGKVRIIGVTEIFGEKVFSLEFLQARDPDLVGRPFFAKYSADATWFDQLEPLSPEFEEFFDPSFYVESDSPLRVLVN